MTREERENALHCLKVMIDEEVCEECNLYGTTGTDHCEADCVRMAIEALKEQKTGHWTHDGSNWTNRWICSECGYKLCYEQSRFCPECGAKMEVKNE